MRSDYPGFNARRVVNIAIGLKIYVISLHCDLAVGVISCGVESMIEVE